ncbi:MAG: cell envelope integrity protein TolA [Gammaproteobacteria bacterium]|nr:cell envelope integrity protein TolA [Gammaproteobacteria bacterium]
MAALIKWFKDVMDWEGWRGQTRYLNYSLLLHLALLLVFIISFGWMAKSQLQQPVEVNVVDAVAVDEGRVLAELDKLRQADAKRRSDEDARTRQLEEQANQAQHRREQEEQRLKEVEKQKQQEQQRAKELSLQKQQETERLEKMKQEQADVAKQREAEQKRLQDLEQKSKAQQERLNKQEEERRRLDEAQRRKELMAEEERRIKAANDRQAQGEVNKYIAIIKQKVTRNWLRPAASQAGLSCLVAVKLAPGGDVLSVRVVKGSGDPQFDASVERAVLKAAPLPLPADPALFDRFRDLRFEFNPEG